MAGQNQDRNIGMRQMGGLAVGGMLVGAGIYYQMVIKPEVHFGNRPIEITRSNLDTLANNQSNLNKAGFRAKFIKLLNEGNKQTTIGMNDILSVSNSVIFVRQKMNDNTKQFQKEFDQILVSHEAVFDTVTHKKIPLIIKFSTKTDLAEGGVKGDKIYVMNINVNDCIKDGKIDKTQIKSIILEQINEFNQKKETFYVAQEDKKVYERISNGISPAINKIIKESSQKKFQASDLLEISKSINGKLRNNSYSKHQYNIEEDTLKNMVKEFNDMLSKTQSGITFELSTSKTGGNLIMKHNNISYLIFNTKLGEEDNINTSEGDTKVSLVQISVGEFKSNTNTITNKPEIQYTSHKPTTNQTKPSTTTISVTGGSIKVTRPQSNDREISSQTKGGYDTYQKFVTFNSEYMDDDKFMTSRFITAVIDGVEGNLKISPVQMQAIAEGHILGSKNGVVKLDRATLFHGDGLSRKAYLNGETNGDSLPNSGVSSTSFLRHEELFEIFSTKFLANLTTPKYAKYKNYTMEQFKNMNKTIDGRAIILDIVENARSSEAGKTRWIDHVLEFETGVLGKELKDSLEATKKNGIILKDMNFFKKNPKAANIVKLFIADTYNQNGEARSQKFLKILNATKDLYFNDKAGNPDYVNWIIRAKMMYYNPNPTIPTTLADAERCASIDTSEATGLTGPIRVATVFENGKFGQRDLNIDKNSPKADGFNKQQHAQIVRADVVRRTKEIVNAVNGSVFDVFNWWNKSKNEK
jgi:hypothetical protein